MSSEKARGGIGGAIRVGIGGWTFEPWRGVFFPVGHPHARELEYASRKLSAIEVNGTYYSSFKPETFAKWREATPDGFVFSLKASRYCTNRKVLRDAGEAVGRFVGQGIAELGDKLGPILWQFMPTKRFDREDFAGFLGLLPAKVGERPLRHAVEVRHASFLDPAFVDLAREHDVAIVYADSGERPELADLTSSLVYARLQSAREEIETGYADADLDAFAVLARAWAAGEDPAELPHVGEGRNGVTPREVFVFMINGAKIRAPAAAVALIARLTE